MTTRNNAALFACVGAIGFPLLVAALLAAGVSANHGTHEIRPAWGTLAANVSTVLKGSVASEGFLWTLVRSCWISFIVALIAVSLAIPLARLLQIRWTVPLWFVAGVTIGCRLLPMTSAIPIFQAVQTRLGAINGEVFAIFISVLTVLPLACAVLCSARWEIIRRGEALLDLDALRGWWDRQSQIMRALEPEIRIAGASVFLFSWGDFIITSFFLPAGKPTIAMLLSNSQGYQGTQWGLLGAGILLSLVPVFLVIVVGIAWAAPKRLIARE